MPQNELVMSTEEINAELSSTEDVDLDSEALDNPELESDDEVPNSWEDGTEGDSEDEEATTDTPQQKKKADQAVSQYKADGRTHEVDLSDQARVDQLITLGLGARRVFSERDQLKKALDTEKKARQEDGRYKDLWNKLEAAKGDHDALYEKIFGRKFEEVYAERKQRDAEYDAASPEERRILDMQRKFEAQQKAWEAQQRDLESKQKDVETKAEEAERREVRSMLMPEFYKHEFSKRVKDPEVAAEKNEALWRLTVGNLKKYGDDWQPDAETIRKEFAKVARMLAGNAQETAKKEVAQITAEKKKAAKTQAQLASTRNYSGSADTSKLAKEKDPVKLWRKMFG